MRSERKWKNRIHQRPQATPFSQLIPKHGWAAWLFCEEERVPQISQTFARTTKFPVGVGSRYNDTSIHFSHVVWCRKSWTMPHPDKRIRQAIEYAISKGFEHHNLP